MRLYIYLHITSLVLINLASLHLFPVIVRPSVFTPSQFSPSLPHFDQIKVIDTRHTQTTVQMSTQASHAPCLKGLSKRFAR